MAGIDDLKGYAIAIGALAVVNMTTIAVVLGFKDTALVDNDTADKFVTGLTIFATFVGVIILALIGKVIVGLYKGE